MGRLLLVSRLVAGDIKRRPVQCALLLVVIVTTTTTLALSLTLRHVAQSPFARTRAATSGPDFVAEVQPNRGSHGAPTRVFAPLLHAPGVAATAGPFPLAFVRLTAPGIDLPVNAEGRASAPTAVNRPLVTSGRWVRPGGVVVEQGLAKALGLQVGDRVRLRGQSFEVVGTALETEQPFYPACTPGIVWITRAAAERLATPADPLGYFLDLRLTHPAQTTAFANSAAVNAFGNETGNEASVLEPWQAIRKGDYKLVGVDQKALLVGGSLLGLLAIASIAVVVGGRMAEQTRRVGLLKAVGATPRLVAGVLLAENLVLSLVGAAVGVLGGWLLAPTIADPGSGLLGAAPTPPLTVTTIAEVTVAALAVAAAATILPAVRGARTSTVGALTDPARPPRRRRRLIALSARLPVPLLLGVRLVARRPRRAILTCASLAVAATMVVAAVTLQYQVDVKKQAHDPIGLFSSSSIAGRVTHVVFILGAVLVVLAGLTAIFTTWATVIDAERSTALSRALGATPRQITGGLTAAQLLPGLVAACIAIPAGLGIFEVAGGHVARANPPLLLLLAVIPATLIGVAVLTAIPARIGARRPGRGPPLRVSATEARTATKIGAKSVNTITRAPLGYGRCREHRS